MKARAWRTVKAVAVPLASTVPQKLPRQGSRRLAVFKGDLTVDQDPVVALGLLDTPPLAAGQVFSDFRRQNFQLGEIIDHDIRRRLLAAGAALFEAAQMGRQIA